MDSVCALSKKSAAVFCMCFGRENELPDGKGDVDGEGNRPSRTPPLETSSERLPPKESKLQAQAK
mgnify:CR=1 FL=1